MSKKACNISAYEEQSGGGEAMVNSQYTLAHLVWPEGAGATSLDQVGGYTASLIGAPVWSAGGSFAGAGWIVLNGADQYITVPGVLASGPREFTVALRYKPSVSLPDASDRRLWSITGRSAPEETLDVLWRQSGDNGGYLWVRGMQDGQPIARDVIITGLRVPIGLWTSIVVTAGLAGVYVFHNGQEVGGNSDFPWPPYDPQGSTDHDFTIGSFSSSPSSFLPASVGEVLIEGRMWTEREAWLWHSANAYYLTEHSKWLKYPANPVLGPTEGWEQDCLQEPNVLYEGGIYKLWYTGGYDPEYIGYATSPDGFSWAKCPINPVLGRGNGGEPATAARGFVVKVDKTYYLYYNSNPCGTGDEKLATSPDGIHWASQGVIIRASDWPWGGGFGNVCVWVEGTTWFMIFEALYSGTGAWEMGAATSDDGRNWRLLGPTPLRSLRIADGGTYGGAMVIKRGRQYHCWYHATPTPEADGRISSFTKVLPTAIYRATSSDLINWQVYSRIPVLSLTQQYEVDQVADPTIAEVNGRCLMLFDQMYDTDRRSRLGLATFDGSLDDLLTDNIVGGSSLIAILDTLLLQ